MVIFYLIFATALQKRLCYRHRNQASKDIISLLQVSRKILKTVYFPIRFIALCYYFSKHEDLTFPFEI